MDLPLADLRRVCRDLAWSDIAAMPGLTNRLGPRVAAPSDSVATESPPIDWSADGMALDSLARMQLATAAASWCNAYDAGFEDLFLAKRNTADWAVVMQRARAAGAAHFTFATSGSTGARKHIRHREDVLAAEAAAWAQVFASPPSAAEPPNPANPSQLAYPVIRRVVVLAPTHHIYGFIWGVLVPLLWGVPAVDADLAALPALLPGDLIVAVPDQWAWLANAPRLFNPGGVQGVSSTAPLPDAVHSALITPAAVHATDHAANGPAPLARLLQIYGSTETGGLAFRAAPGLPYTLAPGRSRNASGGIDLQLPDGSLAAMAVQDELRWADSGGVDGVDGARAGHFQLLRRSDHSVQVGGHNVSPAWVEAQWLAQSGVAAVSVRLSSTAQPPRLKAFVVLHAPEPAGQRAQLEAWAAEHLPWYAAPQHITYGAQLPVNAMGKPADWPEA